MKKMLLILGLFLSINGFAENGKLQCFWVTFSDKNNTVYHVENPTAFLSERAIHRRNMQNIPITENDFPVNATYLEAIKNTNATVKFSSRWFNASAIICTPEVANQIAKLSFVINVEHVGKHFQNQKYIEKNKEKPQRVKIEFSHKYGYAKSQIEMLKGVELHEAGLTGKGKMIAVLDAGFTNVDISPFFEHLRENNQLRYAHDVIGGDKNVFETSVHGTQVLSVMAANIPGVMVGTAPDATYVCIKTEDIQSEFRMDECSWVAGLEYADSLGVDVVNSSLGYTVFDDAKMNYAKEDLASNTALSSQAAALAFSKGMIVVCSAGNEGNNDWKSLSMPADAAQVLAVGSVDYQKNKCDFSSFGWVSEESVKPDVAALGFEVAVVSGENNEVLSGCGTSYSAPLVSGLVAALWQAFPNATNQEIVEAVRKSASDALQPNAEIGFGIPNFSIALNYLGMQKKQEDIFAVKK